MSYTDTQLTVNTSYYYGVTSEEWCGLESDQLSNIIEVTYSGGIYSSQNVEPSGRRGFDMTPPADVQGLAVLPLRTGVNRLTWSPSAEKDLWYYNIYYSTEGIPSASPGRRIASVPRGHSTWIDWEARTDASASYRVTAVDRQGNESSSPAKAIKALGRPLTPRDALFVHALRSSSKAWVEFHLVEEGPVCIDVFDTKGKLVCTLIKGTMSRGPHFVLWNERNGALMPVSGGCYFVRMTTKGSLQVAKIGLTR
jgi:hypothetical protein